MQASTCESSTLKRVGMNAIKTELPGGDGPGVGGDGHDHFLQHRRAIGRAQLWLIGGDGILVLESVVTAPQGRSG